MKYFAGIDSGTQSTKVLIVDQKGTVLGRGQARYGLIKGLPIGHKEQHPDTWIAALRDALGQAISSARIDGGKIAAIGVSGQQHGFVALDAANKPIRPAKLWCDTATAAEAEEIMERNGGLDAYIRLTGNSVPAGFTASKILWLKNNEPENFKRLATVMLPHDYINFWLTGEKKMEHGDASGTALMNVRARDWCGQAIASIDDELPGKIPPLIHSGDVWGTVHPEASRELGLSPDCIVSAGGGDNMMGAIGTGNVSPGIVTVSLGTSGTVYAFSSQPLIDAEKGEIAAFCDSTGNWLPLLCVMNVTAATELVKKTFCIDTRQLNEAARSVPPGADGLMLLPYFEGERVPNVPDGTGVWLGYGERTHTPAHFARAALEGPTLALAYGFNRMKSLGIEPKEIRLTGGGSKSAVWRQIIADVFDAPVVCTKEAEGAALGAAIQARWALERQKNPTAPIAELCETMIEIDEAARCTPNKGAHLPYAVMQEIHDAMSVALRPVFTAHRKMIGG